MLAIKFLHVLSVTIWVGGMFFAYMVLRPSAAKMLQAPERLGLWNDVFARFFKWVWLFSLLTVFSGLYLIHLYGGMGNVSHAVHVMLLLGVLMLGIFVYLFFALYRPFAAAVQAQDWPRAGALLGSIRKLVATNLALASAIFAALMLGQLL